MLRRIVYWAILVSLLVNLMFTVLPSDAASESNVDLFTLKGGRGDSIPSPPFTIDEEIILCVNATYGGWPEPNKDITFQIIGPIGRIFFLAERTNEFGFATVKLAFPVIENSSENFGSWTVFASANIAGVVTVDELRFDLRWNLADINNDLEINLYDVTLLCIAYGATHTDPEWNVQCDIAEPYGIINIIDVVTSTANYTLKWNNPI
jgi:hypothetical protein